MRRGKLFGLLAVAATFLFVGCSGSVEIGPVPTITPKPTVTPAPTPTPVVVATPEVVEPESVYDTKQFKEYYEKENELPQLKVAYDGVFNVGIDVLQIDVTDSDRRAIILEQFNTISLKEDLSPNVLMDYEATRAAGDLNHIVLDFSGADVILKFAQQYGIPVRGPKLITPDTPGWALSKDFSEDQVYKEVVDGVTKTTIDYASADVVLARMENYIKDVITYCNTNYPGVIVSWDALDDPLASDIAAGSTIYRGTCFWYEALEAEYTTKACEFVRQYATPEQKIFVSQIDLTQVGTRNAMVTFANDLKAKNLIDGIAMQSHFAPNLPTVFQVDDMVKAMVGTGLELHITEFYVNSNEDNEEDATRSAEDRIARGTKKYKSMMSSIVNYELKSGYDLVNVTFDSLTDDTGSTNQPIEYYDAASGQLVFGVKRDSYPALFDKDLKVKDAFFAVLLDKSIKAY